MSNSISYQSLAYIYDRLMSDAPYEKWIEYAEREWMKVGIQPKKVLDLACGTGTIAVSLAKKGYQVIGVDLSEDMLAMTYDKGKTAGVTIQFIQQDMRELMLPHAVDAVVSFCDSISYLIEDEDVQATFLRVYDSLVSGGVFLFDVHSIHKIESGFGDETFTLQEEDMAYIWQCHPLENHVVQHELDLFVKEGMYYRRFEEIHEQRGFTEEELRKWLMDAGFENISTSADFLEAEPSKESERLFFRAVKR